MIELRQWNESKPIGHACIHVRNNAPLALYPGLDAVGCAICRVWYYRWEVIKEEKEAKPMATEAKKPEPTIEELFPHLREEM